ncbi:hypothetical protein HaLaN_28339 [Haematococcus lacustris]|uniref:Uncharacterized protein n=1 Tax=Haematococcus lacustris TaxID=44745 RepID=A0A6A0AC74_HAELA|nr:hypothetical protein HaLaN_28339 [Haematococcus lacustris]
MEALVRDKGATCYVKRAFPCLAAADELRRDMTVYVDPGALLWPHNQGLIADIPWLATTANNAPYPPKKRGRKRPIDSAHGVLCPEPWTGPGLQPRLGSPSAPRANASLGAEGHHQLGTAAPANGRVMTLAQLNKALEQMPVPLRIVHSPMIGWALVTPRHCILR